MVARGTADDLCASRLGLLRHRFLLTDRCSISEWQPAMDTIQTGQLKGRPNPAGNL